jgi:shikimate dehydrogenase
MYRPLKKHFGICGYPVAHSLSPKLFKVAYPQSNLSYELIPTSDYREAMRFFMEGGFGGMNVTSPLKTSILAFIHHQTPECEVIGACNLILRQGDLLTAHNTDHTGVANSLQEAAISVKNSVFLLLGAGGAARAAAYALLKGGATLLWANRTTAHIPSSFCGVSPTALPLAEAAMYLSECTVIINTLPHSVPETETFRFHSGQVVFDASYITRPLERQAAETGVKYIGGERWLLHQAIPAFEVMTQSLPNIPSMEETIKTICQYPNYSLF